MLKLMGKKYFHFYSQKVCLSKPVVLAINPLHSGNQQTGTLTNSEDPDEMPNSAEFPSRSALFTKIKTQFNDKIAS